MLTSKEVEQFSDRLRDALRGAKTPSVLTGIQKCLERAERLRSLLIIDEIRNPERK